MAGVKKPKPDSLEEELRKRVREKLLDHAADLSIRHQDLTKGLHSFRINLSRLLGET